jgi:aryl-alcohol dehydrogenase-like predicted oxidoreductase
LPSCSVKARSKSSCAFQNQADTIEDHAWDYTNDSYIHNLNHLRTLQKQGKIGYIGLTNTDAANLELLIDSGFTIATNQISCSVIDRRLVRGRLRSVCTRHGVGILAYGTLLGGYLSEKWLGQDEPQDELTLNWSLRKYLRFINAAVGWPAFQVVLQALSAVAKKHGVSRGERSRSSGRMCRGR